VNDLVARVRRALFAVSPDETTLVKRGFHPCGHDQRIRLEKIGSTFLEGYHAALEADSLAGLESRLNAVELAYRGFGFEGAGMALALLDLITPWKRNRIEAFLGGPADRHAYMVHVGVGWAFARIPFGMNSAFNRLDPVLRWLAMDGYGFHEGYFGGAERIARRTPRRLAGYAVRAFDQGLGRSLWFVEGSDVRRIAAAIARLDGSRHADLWSGVGLACAYAGSIDAGRIEALRVSAGPFAKHLAQGAAFAAKARQRAGNPTPHTELACRVLCRSSADSAARMTDLAFADLSSTADLPAYEVWRRRIAASFVQEISVA
jgi:hypothetical protein